MNLRRRLTQLVRRHRGSRAVVLIYHRVAELSADPQLLCVSPTRFEQQIAMLAQRYRVVPLQDLVDSLSGGTLAEGTVAITLDDGYADNLTSAEPILRAHETPATVYVSSGQVESGREFWWDSLERILLSPGVMPGQLRIEVASGRYEGRLDGTLVYTEADAQVHGSWNVLESSSNSRQRIYSEIASFLRPLPPADRDEALRQLCDAASLPADCGPTRPSHRPLTADEVRSLDTSPVVEVGAHTRDHPVLSACDSSVQHRQILEDRNTLSSWCNRPMVTFSYPYGALGDYTDETVELVRRAGFRSACANHPGLVSPWTDPLRIPRMLVRDWPAEVLATELDRWFRECR